MNKYICIFCNERKTTDTAHKINGKIGICQKCNAEISRTPPNSPYQGSKNINFTVSPFEYRGKLRQVILNFKFEDCPSYAPLLANMMLPYLNSYDIWPDFDYIVPVPLHKSRLRKRGYNQSELLAKELANLLNIPLCTDLLIRSRATKSQRTLPLIERTTNVQNAFSCTRRCDGQKILLIDDIRTSGFTAEACGKSLTENGASLICLLTLSIHEYKNFNKLTY